MAKQLIVDALIKDKSKYKVTISKETFEIDPFLVMKYRLKVGMELDLKTYEQLMFDQKMLFYEELSLKKLKKMLTIHELKSILSENGCPKDIAGILIDRFIKSKYLDDLSYAKAYVSSKKYTYGPLVLKERLKEKGISDEVLTYAFKDYDGYDILMRLIEKKASSIKQKSYQDAKRTLYQSYVLKGFSHELVSAVLSQLENWYQVDTQALIQKQYDLYFMKFSKTHDQYNAHQKAVQKLLSKGFSYQDIKDYIESK